MNDLKLDLGKIITELRLIMKDRSWSRFRTIDYTFDFACFLRA
jgi:hypothetical protein